MTRKVIALVAALVVAVMFSSPALAQTNAGAAVQSTGTANVTFQLKLNGQVPGWQNFVVEHYVDGKAVQTPLCTTGTDADAAGPFCESGGVYTATVQVPAGAPIAFDFLRQDTRTAPERFLNETRAFTGNNVVEASYNFPGAAPADPSTTSAATTSVAATSEATTDAATTTSVAATAPAPGETTPATTVAAATGQETSAAAPGETASTVDSSEISSAGGTTGSTSDNASGVTSGTEAVTVARILPDTGGSPLLVLLGGSLLIVAATGFAIRRRS